MSGAETQSGLTPVVQACGLTFTYGDLQAVRDVNLSLRPGVTALLGPNGAGKTSLLRLLATVARPSTGGFRHLGEPVEGRYLRAYRRSLGYLPQKPSWHGWMTVRETVSYFAWLRRVPRPQAAGLVQEAIDRVGLDSRAGERLSRLSGGMRQRALLATVIVHRPSVLILDEPSVGLDPAQRVELRAILREIHPDGVVLVSTHILEDVATLADDVLIMKEGTIRHSGPLGEIRRARGTQGDDSPSTQLEAAYLEIIGRG